MDAMEGCSDRKLLRKITNRLKSICRPLGGIDEVDVRNGFFMVKFDFAIRIEKKLIIDWILVWIHSSSLTIEYYGKSVFFALPSTVGKLVKVDIRTTNVLRERFTRVYVEINLD
ncbi:hypothetical protein GmHk_04G010003 [Glycine max]|nr:hypothetical protein GmHk_04G010003 [Glycine max]